jgi:hypothetical protein
LHLARSRRAFYAPYVAQECAVHDDTPDSPVDRSVDTVSPRQAAYIEIVEESDTFPWQYTDADGVTYATKFELRLLPETLDKKWRRELTSIDRKKGQRAEVLNWDAYSQRALGYCVVNVSGLRRRGGDEIVFKTGAVELRYLLLLPEKVKAEIIRLCVGKEAGLQDKEDEHPSA